MDDSTVLGSTLGQLGQTTKKVGQQMSKLPGEMGKAAVEQIGGQNEEESAVLTKGSGPLRSEASEPRQSKWQSDEERAKFLRDLYGSAQQNPLEAKKENPQAARDKKPSEFQEQIKNKTPEEQKSEMELRQKLHKETYYDPTFNPSPAKPEERPAEKVENEKKKEMMELQQKEEKKPTNWAVVREQNKAEVFRGAAG